MWSIDEEALPLLFEGLYLWDNKRVLTQNRRMKQAGLAGWAKHSESGLVRRALSRAQPTGNGARGLA